MEHTKRVRLEELDAAVEELTKKNRIIGISHPNDMCAVILYEPRGKRSAPGDVETRVDPDVAAALSESQRITAKRTGFS